MAAPQRQWQRRRRQRSRPLAFAGRVCAPPRPMTRRRSWSSQRTSQWLAMDQSWFCPAAELFAGQYRCGALQKRSLYLRARRSALLQAAGRVQRQPSTATATAFFLLGLPKQPIRCPRSPASAERAALRLGHQLSRHPCAGHKRGLTPRSSRAPTAGHAGPAGGTLYIFASRARASHRRCRLNSNVRPQIPLD